MRRIGPILVFALGLGLAATAAQAIQQAAILGAGGELYVAKSGTYGELFPGLNDHDSTNPVLRLDVVKPDGSLHSSLVPGTEGPEVEDPPFLQYEETSNTVFLVWESRLNVIHPILMLSGYNGDWVWDAPIEIVSNPYAAKTSPQLTVTHDSYTQPVTGGDPVTRQRTTLHVLWGEETATGSIETNYTPVILEDGVFTGLSPIFRLTALDSAAAADSTGLSPDLLRALRVQRGRDERTVIVGFMSPRTAKLVTAEIDSLPPQLVQLADKARSHIVDIGKALYPSQIGKLAEAERSYVVDNGVAFYPEVVRTIADEVKSCILSSPPGSDLNSIADKARAHIVDIGVKLAGRGLRAFGGDAAAQIAEVAVQQTAGPAAGTASPSQVIQLRLTSSRPAPIVGSSPGTGETRLSVSETGERVIASWLDTAGNQLFYRISNDGTWSDPLVLKLSDSLSLTDAYAVLDQRVRSH